MRISKILPLVLLALHGPGIVHASSIDSYVLGGGGGHATSTTFSLFAVMGQAIAGSASGPTLTLHVGLVPRIGGGGLVAAETELPKATRLGRVAPNPFNGTTTIPFDLAAPAPITIQIFDVRGRLVRVLVDEILPAGRHSISWTGASPGTDHVAPGVYYCQFTSGSTRSTQRLVFLP